MTVLASRGSSKAVSADIPWIAVGVTGIYRGSKKNVLDLEDEVLSGKCHLVIGPEGPTQIVRVVSCPIETSLNDSL
eukprot:4128140-Amphidinium_carterae.1